VLPPRSGAEIILLGIAVQRFRKPLDWLG